MDMMLTVLDPPFTQVYLRFYTVAHRLCRPYAPSTLPVPASTSSSASAGDVFVAEGPQLPSLPPWARPLWGSHPALAVAAALSRALTPKQIDAVRCDNTTGLSLANQHVLTKTLYFSFFRSWPCISRPQRLHALPSLLPPPP